MKEMVMNGDMRPFLQLLNHLLVVRPLKAEMNDKPAQEMHILKGTDAPASNKEIGHEIT